MKTLIIAEIGQNHNGDMKIARKLIRRAKECGADIVKFQIYDVDKIFAPSFKWYKEAKDAQLNKNEVIDLFKECKKVGIEFMASVFDVNRVKWTEEIGMKRYKIASRSIRDAKLINAVSKTGKDMIVSLGMWKEKEFPKIHSKGKIDFLYCVSKYPTPLEEVNLRKVDFNKYSGFSDHTIGIEAAMVAISRGARIIEKHFTLDKKMHGPDHSCSMDPKELSELVSFARKAEKILG